MKHFTGKKLFWSLMLAEVYTLLIFVSLYFSPFLGAFLIERSLLSHFVSGIYLLFALFALTLFLFRYRLTNWKAYFLFFVVLALFFLQFFNIHLLIERIHLLEYGLFYALWFRVFRHFFSNILVYGVTLLFTSFVGFLEELLQHLLPNRHFDWGDVSLNISGMLLSILAIAIFMHYRRDSSNLGEEGESDVG